MSIIRRPEQIFDIRLLERNKNKGLYEDKEYKKWVKELPDVKENADFICAADLFDEAKELLEEEEETLEPGDEQPPAEQPDEDVQE